MQQEITMTFKRVQQEDNDVIQYADFVEALAIVAAIK
jgi:hypothetical protein